MHTVKATGLVNLLVNFNYVHKNSSENWVSSPLLMVACTVCFEEAKINSRKL